MARVPFLIILLLISFLMVPLLAQDSLHIYYSSSLNGNLIGCDCKDHPRAGLVKRSYYLQDRNRNNSILIELGDVLDIFPDTDTHNLIKESYRNLGYDLWMPGDQDWNEGMEWLLESGITLAADNIVIKTPRGERALSEPVVFQKAGWTVGIVSLVQQDAYGYIPRELRDNIMVKDPFPMAQDLSSQLRPQVDLLILMYHGHLEKGEIIGQIAPDFDLILLGHEQMLLNEEGQIPLYSPGEEGNYLGILEVTGEPGDFQLENRFQSFDFLTSPDDEALLERAEVLE